MNKRYLFYILAALFIVIALTGFAEEVSCAACNQSADEMTLVASNDDVHTLQCACGKQFTVAHSWSEWRSGGDGAHTRTCSAGCTDAELCHGGTATCTTRAKCAACSAEYGGTDPLNHTWNSGIITSAASCSADGVMTFTCLSDASHISTKPIPMNAGAHQWDGGAVATEPDCSNEGLLRFTCTIDKTHTREEIIPVRTDAHAWDDGVIVTEPDCASEGRIRYTCTINKTHTMEAAIPVDADAHTWDDGVETRASTCRTPGILTHTCLNSSKHTYTVELPIDPEAHFFRDSIVLQPASCTKEGIISYTCLYSVSHVVQETIPVDPEAHRWDGGSVIRRADCVNTGEVLYTCIDNSAHTRTDTIAVDLSTHEWDERIVTLEATCTRSGEITLFCALDRNHTGTESIPPLGHSWTISAITQEPDCEEPGIMTHTCANNAAHTKEETLPALGHVWGNMEIISEPTCTRTGAESYTCKRDSDHTTTVELAADPDAHSYIATEEVAVLPGVCADGEAYVTLCEECGNAGRETISAPSNHVFTEWDFDDAGNHTSVCSACGGYTVRILCHDTSKLPCPICLDRQVTLSSVQAIASKDDAGISDYVIGASAGSRLMHLAVYAEEQGTLITADFDSPITIYLNAEQIAAALESSTDAYAQRAIAILQSENCRIRRHEDFVILRSDDDALVLRVFVHLPDEESDELFCHISSGVISFDLRRKHMQDDQMNVWFVLEEK